MSSAGKTPIPDAIRKEAANWLARNEGDHPADDAAQFKVWLAADLRHRLAYAEAERAWRESLALAGTRVGMRRSLARAPLHLRRSTHVAALSLVVLLGAGLLSVHVIDHSPVVGVGASVEARTYRTEPGEARTWTLPDGTSLSLQGASFVRTQFDASLRRIDIEQGSARIAAAGDDRRPLEIHAGDLAATTRDAVADVIASGPSRRITIVSGSAEAAQGTGSRRLIKAGQSIGEPDPAKPASGTEASNSSGSVLATNDMTVGEAIERLNRSNATKLRIVGGAIADRRLSGGFRTDDPEIFASALAALGDLELMRSGDEIILRQR